MRWSLRVLGLIALPVMETPGCNSPLSPAVIVAASAAVLLLLLHSPPPLPQQHLSLLLLPLSLLPLSLLSSTGPP
jgi:hypothetical protein